MTLPSVPQPDPQRAPHGDAGAPSTANPENLQPIDAASVPDSAEPTERSKESVVRVETTDASPYFSTHVEDVDVQALGAPLGSPDSSQPRPQRKVSTLTALVAVIAVLVCACAYVTYLAVRWSDFGEATHAANQELGLSIAQTTEELESARASLEATRSQLTTAQQRISELANEKAEAGDDREQQRIRAEDTFAVATESLGVSSDLAQCLTLQNTALSHLTAMSNAQGVVSAQALKPVEDRDLGLITQSSETISSQRTALVEMQNEMIETCQDAIDRHNKLVDDLAE